MTPTRRPRESAAFAVHRDGSDEIAWVVSYSSPPPPHVLEAYRRRGLCCVPVTSAEAQAITRRASDWCVRNGKCERRPSGARREP